MMWVGVVDDIGPFLFSLKRENYIRKGFICTVKAPQSPRRNIPSYNKKKQPMPLMGNGRLVFMRVLFLVPYFADIVTKGRIISSREMPPCCREPLYLRICSLRLLG